MTRARLAALLALACALAAAAAGSGPFLVADRTAPPFVLRRATRLYRPRAPAVTNPVLHRVERVTEVLLQAFVAVVAAALVVWGAYHLVRVLVRLTRLRLVRARGVAPAMPYDEGEHDDDETHSALRRRVVDELGLLATDLDEPAQAREAVIACYVRMEAAFAAAGAARGASETPTELVARVLRELRVPEPDVRRLTELFTEARFSRHPMDDEMRDAARRSLRNVAGALGVPA